MMPRKFLPAAAAALVVALILLAGVLAVRTTPLSAILSLLMAYWTGCWFLMLLTGSNGPPAASPRQRIKLLDWLIWLPVFGVCVVTVTKSIALPSPATVATLASIAMVNGITEEFFWRRTFANAFVSDRARGLVIPWLLFSLWHVALLRISEVNYEGGGFALVGGAAVMGALWGSCYWFNRNLLGICSAHATTNMFAFYMLANDNHWLGG